MPEEPEPPQEPEPPRETNPPREDVPGAVLAASILLYVGGALTVVYALVGIHGGGLVRGLLPGSGYALYGLAYVGLGWAVRRGRPWARRTVLVLCGIGAALALVRLFHAGPASAVRGLAWPAVYASLLSTEKSRAWFRRRGPEPTGR
jgi:hypothetical protein